MIPSSTTYCDSGFRKHTSSPSKAIASLPMMLAAVLCTLSFEPAFTADTEGWIRYENEFFIAYSNGTSKHVTDILESLEQFRGAALQIPTFVVPVGRPKTLVILPASHKEFLAFAYYESIAGFAAVLAGRPTIVMPAADPDINSRVVVGHEFAHTLLFNDYFKHPPWYSEGFAEIASSIVVDGQSSTFTIGSRDDLRINAAKPAIDWNILVQSTFDAHTQSNPDNTASAYAQDWLLVHYLTLNKSANFASELNHYLANINNGMPSVPAFSDAFGKSAADFWQDDLQTYLGEIENITFDFDPTRLDLNFLESNANEDELGPILKFLKDNADIRHGRNAPADPIPHLPGQWDWFRLDDQCSDPMTFRMREDANILVLDSYYSDYDRDPVPALFSVDTDGDGTLVLTNVTSQEYPQVTVTSDYRAVMRSKDVMCFDAWPAPRNCLRVLHRCD